MRTPVTALLFLATIFSAAAAKPACEGIPGIEKLWAKPATHFILFGEMHGTTEAPKLFGESVCAAIAAGKPVTVGLEFPRKEGQAIESYLASHGTVADRAALLSGAHWKGTAYGLSSQAMLDVIERLRQLRLGAHFDVIVFVPDFRGTFDPAQYESDMAAELTSTPKGSLVMALMGNMHARVSADLGSGQSMRYAPMAAHLPLEQVVAVQVLPIHGGTAWNCQPAKDRLGSECAPHAMWNTPTAPGVTLFAAPRSGYHGVLGFDRATASPPAVPSETAK